MPVIVPNRTISPGTNQPVTIGDGPNLSAFGGLRVAEPVLLLDLKRVGGTPDDRATQLATGAGSLTVPYGYDTNLSATLLGMTTGGVGRVTRQTRARAVYQPGKGLVMDQTFVAALRQANLIQRFGYFDDNDGAFFRLNGINSPECVIRTSTSGSPVDIAVAQATWNVDRMDGTGPSGIVLDFTKSQILVIDLQWLGVGRVRFGWNVNGQLFECHEFYHANIQDRVYMKNPNLPVRWELETVGVIAQATSAQAICCSVNSEGGYEINGVTCSTRSTALATPAVGRSLTSGTTAEILAIRMQNGAGGAAQFADYCTAFVQKLTAVNTSSGPFEWRLVLNPTETVAGAWLQDINGSIMERNLSRTVTPDTGIVLDSGMVSAQSNSVQIDTRPVLTLGKTLTGITDVVSLQIVNINNQTETYFATMTWREIY